MKKMTLMLTLFFFFSVNVKAQFAVFDGANLANAVEQLIQLERQLEKASQTIAKVETINRNLSTTAQVLKSVKRLEHSINNCNSVAAAHGVVADFGSAAYSTMYATKAIKELLLMGNVLNLNDRERLDMLGKVLQEMTRTANKFNTLAYQIEYNNRIRDILY